MADDRDTRRSIGVIAGAVLVLLGVWFLLRNAGIIQDWMVALWNRVAWPVAIIVLGIALVVIAQRGGVAFRGPEPGARLYRSTHDRWVAGVFGGLGSYLGVDPLLLRFVFIVLVLAGWGWPVIAYIVLAVVVPREPASQARHRAPGTT